MTVSPQSTGCVAFNVSLGSVGASSGVGPDALRGAKFAWSVSLGRVGEEDEA
jgi:hypothetical protein